MRFSELAIAMRCVGDIDPPNLTFCFNLNQITPLTISVAFRGVRTAHCHKSLLTTTMSKSSLVLARKYCIIFGFFPLFLLHCLNDHLYRCFIMMTTKTSPPLKQPQCHHSCKSEGEGHNSGPAQGKQDLSGCLKRRMPE